MFAPVTRGGITSRGAADRAGVAVLVIREVPSARPAAERWSVRQQRELGIARQRLSSNRFAISLCDVGGQTHEQRSAERPLRGRRRPRTEIHAARSSPGRSHWAVGPAPD